MYEIYYLKNSFNFHYIKSNNKNTLIIFHPHIIIYHIYKDINKLKFKKKIFIDLGCGTGRVLNFFL